MQWALVAVVSCGVLIAAVVAGGIRATAPASARNVTALAALSGFVAAVLVAGALYRVPRPWVLAPGAVVERGRPFACSGRLALAPSGVAHGSVDLVRTEPNDLPVQAASKIARTSTLLIQGWATDAGAQHTLAGVCLLVDGHAVTGESATYGSSRPDVARVFKDAAVLNSGFEISAGVVGIARGRHRLEVVGVDAGRRASPVAPALELRFR